VINYLLLGLASGFILATALASHYKSPIIEVYAAWSILFFLASTGSRMFSLYRNPRVKHKSSAGTALGIRYLRIRQISQGVMDGSFNTCEFFSHSSLQLMLLIKIFFPVASFV
jgi:hypothetical protein